MKYLAVLLLIPSIAFAQSVPHSVDASIPAMQSMLHRSLDETIALRGELLLAQQQAKQEKERADAAEAKLKASDKPAEPAKP